MNFDDLTTADLRRLWRRILARFPDEGWPRYGWDWPTFRMVHPHAARVLAEINRALARKLEPRT